MTLFFLFIFNSSNPSRIIQGPQALSPNSGTLGHCSVLSYEKDTALVVSSFFYGRPRVLHEYEANLFFFFFASLRLHLVCNERYERGGVCVHARIYHISKHHPLRANPEHVRPFVVAFSRRLIVVRRSTPPSYIIWRT